MVIAARQSTKEAQFVVDVDERIRRRAYEMYEQRGREDGHDCEDWLQAEAEILGKPRKLAKLTVVK